MPSDVIQWFPGHMAKARRQIEKNLSKVDIVAELVDARVPVSSRNPILKKIIGNKPHIILLNKSDLADPQKTAEWIAFYKSRGTQAVALDSRSGKNVKSIIV